MFHDAEFEKCSAICQRHFSRWREGVFTRGRKGRGRSIRLSICSLKWQTAQPDHRRDRNRQDGDAANAGGNFSARGVPVFNGRCERRLAGADSAGRNNPKVVRRAKELKIVDFKDEACPPSFSETCLARAAIPFARPCPKCGSRLSQSEDVLSNAARVSSTPLFVRTLK